MAKPNDREKKWYVIDASDKPMGRVASEAASILRGKHTPFFTPHMDTGDFVIIINAEKAVLTGNKLQQKKFRYHTGYPGGLKEIPYDKLMVKNPEKAMKHAVTGMLPHTRLGRSMASKLKIYRGADHPHQAQQPLVWELRG
jgi:large subunit ribosomal protein L13